MIGGGSGSEICQGGSGFGGFLFFFPFFGLMWRKKEK